MIEEKTFKYIKFATGYNSLSIEDLTAFAESEIEELNQYNIGLHYEVVDINTNVILRNYIIEGLKLSLQTRWGNNLEYHKDKRLSYLNRLTNMQV
jgi:hypothetical protein|nr:MAG TPA: hypothetical protein [Caudoviricetes sp.]